MLAQGTPVLTFRFNFLPTVYCLIKYLPFLKFSRHVLSLFLAIFCVLRVPTWEAESRTKVSVRGELSPTSLFYFLPQVDHRHKIRCVNISGEHHDSQELMQSSARALLKLHFVTATSSVFLF